MTSSYEIEWAGSSLPGQFTQAEWNIYFLEVKDCLSDDNDELRLQL